MSQHEPLEPFRPPYELGGSCFAITGAWEGDGPPALSECARALAALGYRPVRVLGRPVGIVVVSHYSRPPRELPIRYHEAIAATAVWRGPRPGGLGGDLKVLPVDMVLDEELPVELGREHYGLPKRLDRAMVVRIDGRRAWVKARAFEVQARARGPLARALASPISLAFALATRAVTRWVDVLGVATPPDRRARVALRPRGLGTSFRASLCVADGVPLRGLWCQSWSWTTTWLGPPEPASRGELADGGTP